MFLKNIILHTFNTLKLMCFIMSDLSIITGLKERIINLEERLSAIEKEQRKIIEDILSGEALERMHMRMLERPKDNVSEKMKKIENSRIEI